MRVTLIFGFVILSGLVVGACTLITGSGSAELPPVPTQDSGGPTPAPAVRPTQAGLPGSRHEPGSEEVLGACTAGGQAAAMRPGFGPDLESLAYSACYELELELSLEPPGYTGSARVTYANRTGQELAELVFRLYPNAESLYGGELEVSSARVDGMPVHSEVFLPDQTALRLSLEDPLPPGGITVVDLEFFAQIPVDRDGLSGVYGTFNYDSSTEVLVLANGYPILATWEESGWRADPVVGIGDAVVSEVALYQARITAPPGWQVVATGVQVPESSGGNSSTVFASGPVREFMLVASPNFVENQAQVNGVQVRHWGLPDGEERWEASLQAAVDSIALFDERFGPYPYSELDVVAAPLWIAAGVEYPGLILLRQALYLSGSNRSPGLEYVVAHEVAHQWWYGVVGNDVLEHPWQDEALATYSALLYQEEYQPEAYAGTLLFYRGRVAELETGEGDSEVAQPVEAFQENPGAYSPVVYIKGSLLFDDLRERLGKDTFFNALQAYYKQNAFGLPPPEALLMAFEQACTCSLGPVYQEWGVK